MKNKNKLKINNKIREFVTNFISNKNIKLNLNSINTLLIALHNNFTNIDMISEFPNS